jgi:RecA/RadA recombinase
VARKSLSQVEQLRDRINVGLKGNVVTLGSEYPGLTKITTGSLVLDRLTLGGIARGRHTVVVGDWAAGKSLMVYRTMVLAQERGETCALIDAEGVFNANWFRQLGGDPEKLLIYPDRRLIGQAKRDANELGNVLRMTIQKGEGIVPADVVAIDSVASLLPSEEMEHDLEDGDPRVASLARLMPLLLRMLTTQNDQTAFIWTNQWRDKISRIPGLRSSPGGKAIGFFASTIIELSQGEKETAEHDVVVKGKTVKRKVVTGRWVQATLAKDKTGARPFSSGNYLLDFATRKPSTGREIVDLGMTDGFVDRSGDRYTITPLEGESLTLHGIAKTVKQIEADDELREGLVLMIEERTRELADEAAQIEA